MTYNEFITKNLAYRVANQSLTNDPSTLSSVLVCINATIVYFNRLFASDIKVLEGNSSGAGKPSDLDRAIDDDMDLNIALGPFQDRVVSDWFIQSNAMPRISTASIIANNSEEMLKTTAIWDNVDKKLKNDLTDSNDYIWWGDPV